MMDVGVNGWLGLDDGCGVNGWLSLDDDVGVCGWLSLDDGCEGQWQAGQGWWMKESVVGWLDIYYSDRPVNFATTKALQVHLEQLDAAHNVVDWVPSSIPTSIVLGHNMYGDIGAVRVENPENKCLGSGTVGELKAGINGCSGELLVAVILEINKLPLVYMVQKPPTAEPPDGHALRARLDAQLNSWVLKAGDIMARELQMGEIWYGGCPLITHPMIIGVMRPRACPRW